MKIIKIKDTLGYLLLITFCVALFDIVTTISFINHDHIYEANPFISHILLNYGIIGFIAIKLGGVLSIIIVVSRLIDFNKKLVELKRLNYLNMCYGICFSIIIGNIVVGIQNILVSAGNIYFFKESDPLLPLALVIILPIAIGFMLDFYTYQLSRLHFCVNIPTKE
jgi:hypothetical protein